MKKAIGYICAPCEFITVELIQRIEEAHKKFKVVGVGIHSDNFFLQQNGRKPIKKYEDRSNLVKALKGVDFVFELDSENDIDISDLPIDTTTSIDFPKQYRVAYAPGTYDLFHEGHLEHLKEVRTLCEILIVGVNSDEVVWKNKAKRTKISELYITKKILELANQNESGQDVAIQDEKQNEVNKNGIPKKESHIGYYLIDNGIYDLYKALNIKQKKQIKEENKAKLYVALVAILSILTSLGISVIWNKHFGNIGTSIVSFFLFLIPISEIVIQTTQFILSKMVKPKLIPKLDFINRYRRRT